MSGFLLEDVVILRPLRGNRGIFRAPLARLEEKEPLLEVAEMDFSQRAPAVGRAFPASPEQGDPLGDCAASDSPATADHLTMRVSDLVFSLPQQAPPPLAILHL